jgi:hypothetical protein
MKRFTNVFTRIFVFILVVLSIAGCTKEQAIPLLELPKIAAPMPKNLPFFINLEVMPDFPDRIMVYKFVERDPAQVKENFKRYLQEGYRLDFYAGNQFFLTDEKATPSPFIDPEETELKQLPNEEEAVEIAVDFLKETGLYGPDIALTQTQILYETETRFKGDEKITYKICCLVPFSKFIDGYRIRGAHVTIGVGHKGNIDHATIGYMETRPYREVEIISPEEALTMLTDENSSLYIPDGAEELFIDNIELAYFETEEPIAKQPYLQPVYIVSGKVKPVLDPEADTWQCVIPAMKP